MLFFWKGEWARWTCYCVGGVSPSHLKMQQNKRLESLTTEKKCKLQALVSQRKDVHSLSYVFKIDSKAISETVFCISFIVWLKRLVYVLEQHNLMLREGVISHKSVEEKEAPEVSRQRKSDLNCVTFLDDA